MRNRTDLKVTLFLIRHGETAANREHRYLGRTDEPLSEAGRAELILKKKEITSFALMLFSSPMLRCRQTAEILFPEKDPVLIPEWTEMDFGRFEGKNYKELNGDADYQAWIDSGGTLPFPGGESREDFIRRTTMGFERAMEYLRKQSTAENVLEIQAAAVVNGGTIMALCSFFSGGAYFDFQVENGSGYVCRFSFPAVQADGVEYVQKHGMEIRKL